MLSGKDGRGEGGRGEEGEGGGGRVRVVGGELVEKGLTELCLFPFIERERDFQQHKK